MSLVVSREQRDASAITKEEWREYTKTVWSIANVSDPEHPAVFPPELPKRLIKMFSFIDEHFESEHSCILCDISWCGLRATSAD